MGCVAKVSVCMFSFYVLHCVSCANFSLLKTIFGWRGNGNGWIDGVRAIDGSSRKHTVMRTWTL